MKENITINNDLKNKKLDKDLNKKAKTNTRKVKKKLGMGLSSLLSKDQELASVIRTKIQNQVRKSPLKIETPKLSKKDDSKLSILNIKPKEISNQNQILDELEMIKTSIGDLDYDIHEIEEKINKPN